MESVSAGQAADIIVILESVDANGAGIASRAKALRRDGGVDVLVILIEIVLT